MDSERTVMSYCCDRGRSVTWGILGGLPSIPHSVSLNPGTDQARNLGTIFSNVPVKVGDSFTRPSAGGGGLGDPLERQLEAVLEDVIDGGETERARAFIRSNRKAWLKEEPEIVRERYLNQEIARTFWVGFTAISAIVLMLGNVLNYIGPMLTFQGVFLFAWAAILVADAVVVKQILKIGPNYFEYQREKLFPWNPVGVVSLIIASSFGSVAAFGYMGPFLQNISAFMAAVIAFILTIVLAVATQGSYYSKLSKEELSEQNLVVESSRS